MDMEKLRKAENKIEAKSKTLTDTWVGGMRHPVGVYKQKTTTSQHGRYTNHTTS